MKDLSIPENISLDKEIAKHLRKKDLPKLGMLAVPGTIIGTLVWLFSSDRPMVQLIAMASTFGYLLLCYIIVARADGSQSIWDYVARLLRYRQEQQRFYYKHREERIYDAFSTEEGSQNTDSAGID